MPSHAIEAGLAGLDRRNGLPLLAGASIGLEKEALRVAPEGGVSQAPHPQALGSALTHPWITTDYSEALLELVTPPFAGIDPALEFLADLQTWVQQRLPEELLWATSMPCVLHGEDSIPIARYGDSNAGRMKHIYRVGLGHRYGRVMQVIAGVHFNYSVDPAFWPLWQQQRRDGSSLRDFTDACYMGLLRNLQRFGWLVPYLFGASPAVCKSFFQQRPRHMQAFDEGTYYEPFATSLRMGDIGYQNRKEEGVGIKANYDSLVDYLASLSHAISTPALIWEEIGVKLDGEYRQLNANILQIENEYYSTVRPKQPLQGLEKPVEALGQRGIRYVELRSLDVNIYQPTGVDGVQLRFLHLLMQFCLLLDSPPLDRRERREIDLNLAAVAHRGREPGLCLQRQGEAVELRRWADELLQAMLPLCDSMGRARPDYAQALEQQREKVRDPNATPSALILQEMREQGEGFYPFAQRMSRQHRRFFAQRRLGAGVQASFDAEVERSLQKQRETEAADRVDFDQFLSAYQARGLV
ncbi:glutamate--cysteine ligase [Magnetovirga frankeli]|uniref:glutamate--cysteine ligase n=1 Tax=Magnetovirga frankeli TaxID=947516 RepID=UPI001292E3D6|nr:glutamate--cysteine ligase [gamma proteobacterium SS-5]